MISNRVNLWRALSVFAVMVLAASAVTAAPQEKGSFDRTLNVSGTPDISVQTGSGSITVKPGSASTVRILATIEGSKWRGSEDVAERIRYIEQNPPIEQNGNTIVIGKFKDNDLTRNISINYELTVPETSSVQGSSGSGNVHIESVKGPVTASTGSGSVELLRTGGEIRASTGSGGIEIDSTGGNVKASTGSGSIRIAGLTGTLSASTGSGSIRAAGKQGGDWLLSTGSGSVTVDISEEGGFTLDAHTGSGSIQTDHPVTVSGTFKHDTLRGDVRGGGPLLKIRTGSGSIRIN